MIRKEKPNVVAIIPARFGSSRFPGKPLAKIAGKPLIQWTYENALRSPSLDQVIVATDDERIVKQVKAFGGEVTLTSPTCPTGTDRIAEVIKTDPRLAQASFIINVQGDEPCLAPSTIEAVIKALKQDSEAVISTAITPIRTKEEAISPHVVKCVRDQKGHALYFSRCIIPGGRGCQFHPSITYYKHIGIYGFTRSFLLQYGKLPVTPLQQAEDLEQLKVLEHGYTIHTNIVESDSIGIDTPEDLKKVEELLCQRNTSS